MTTLTYPEVLAEIGELVAENPNRVYQAPEGHVPPERYRNDSDYTCWYVHNDPWHEGLSCGCIMSHWLVHRRDVSLTWLLEHEQENIAFILTAWLNVTVDEDAARFLAKLQELQDSGFTWSEAYNHAIFATEGLA